MPDQPVELGGVPLSLLRERLATVTSARETLTAALGGLNAQTALLEDLIVAAEQREADALASFLGAPAAGEGR